MTGTRGGTSSGTSAGTSRARDREILRLAVPAFLALVAEPLFLLSDAAIVGHLGTPQLAGLGIAGAVLQTVVGLCVFLAYGTTASVARRLGVVPLLVVLAATGILRGLQDTRTPLVVAVAGNLANIALNVLLVYGLHIGIAGSATGSVLAQVGSALGLLAVVVRAARREGAALRPDLAGVRRAAHAGVALVVRTLTLRASLLVMTYGAATLGATSVAAHQLASTIWTFLAFALDAVAIAAQALTGRTLGAGELAETRAVTDRMVRWGLVSGVVTAVGLALTAPLLGGLFTADPQVRDLLWPVLLAAAVFQPVAGVVFVLDGVLIGAGDGRYLAWGGVAVLAVFVPLAWLALRLAGSGLLPGPALVWLWVAFGTGFMGSRAVVLLSRARGSRWMVTGVEPRRVTG